MGAAVGFLDPECSNLTMLTSKAHSVDFIVSYMKCAFQLYAKQKLILSAYHIANHSIAVVILSK
jgi:hypothetical protein